jgi:hypothetical protein
MFAENAMKRWLHYLWENEDGFFGIGQGPSHGEKQQFYDMSNLANFATSKGESDINSADNFWKSILSGDPNKISKVLGPAISGINKRAQQQKKTAAEFGNRSGGTNAAQQEAGDQVRSEYDTMVSGLTGEAASALGASGSSLLAAGASGHEAAFSEANTIQQQRAAQLNDIFKSITSIAKAFINPAESTSGGGGGGLFKGAAEGAFNNQVQPTLDTSYADQTIS